MWYKAYPTQLLKEQKIECYHQTPVSIIGGKLHWEYLDVNLKKG